MTRRAYTKTTRALSEAETRQRIVDAMVELHQERGPARTSVSAIADLAGVQRLTVYRHFPDPLSMFTACSARWSESHALPDLAATRATSGRARAREILIALYGYYRDGEKILAHLQTDAEKLPELEPITAPFRSYLEDVVRELDRAWPRSSQRRRTTIRMVVQFTTWRSLSKLTTTDREIADLVLRWIEHS